jgi:uncharacterized protein YdcH (DUF465 family)
LVPIDRIGKIQGSGTNTGRARSTNLRAGKEETLTEQEIIELLKKESEEFKKLDEEHRNLKNTLVEIDRKVYLTTEEEVERKKLQKLKLIKKDRMAELIRDYRKGRSN